MLLAIDTSTRFAGVALFQEGTVTAALSWHSWQNHTAEVAPAIQRVMEQRGSQLSDVKSIAIALGPGGFSALKVGMSMAKGMALGLNIPLVGVNTLEMEAYSHRDMGLPVCPLLSMGRGEYAWTLYQEIEGQWKQKREPGLAKPESMGESLTQRTLFCGEAAQELQAVLKETSGGRAVMQGFYSPAGRLWSLAFLGWQRTEEGRSEDMSTLQPFYLRHPSIGPPKGQRKVKL